MRQIQVFVSSTMDELAYERETAVDVIGRFSASPGLFELFPAMSMAPARAYIEAVRECDMLVLIIYRQWSAAVMAEFEEAVAQDKPVIVLVRASEEPRDAQIQQFLAGLQGRDAVMRVPRYVYKTFGTLRQFRESLHEALVHEMSRRFQPPLHTQTREEMYDLGTDIVQYSQRRIAVFERTPSLFLGARPYHAKQDGKWGYEERFVRAWEGWIATAVTDTRREFVYTFSTDYTQRLIAAQSDAVRVAIRATLTERATYYKDLERQSGLRLRFAPLATISVPVIVGDSRVAFWMLGGQDLAVCIQQENRQIAQFVVQMLKAHMVQSVDADAMMAACFP
jgi:hypothetical protein